MRPNTLVVSLLVSAAAAPSALAAPVVLIQGIVAAVSAPVQKVVSEHDQSLSPADIDNRPYTPSSKASPAVVLTTPRPLITAYLMGLAPPAPAPASSNSKSKESSVRQQGRLGESATLAAKRPKTGRRPEDEEALDEAEAVIAATYSKSMETNFENANKVSLPCIYPQLRHAQNEMMVISMVAVFLLVIVVIEFWDTYRQKTMDLEAGPVGVIRLEDGKISHSSELQPLSVQAPPMHFGLATAVGDEKPKSN